MSDGRTSPQVKSDKLIVTECLSYDGTLLQSNRNKGFTERKYRDTTQYENRSRILC